MKRKLNFFLGALTISSLLSVSVLSSSCIFKKTSDNETKNDDSDKLIPQQPNIETKKSSNSVEDKGNLSSRLEKEKDMLSGDLDESQKKSTPETSAPVHPETPKITNTPETQSTPDPEKKHDNSTESSDEEISSKTKKESDVLGIDNDNSDSSHKNEAPNNSKNENESDDSSSKPPISENQNNSSLEPLSDDLQLEDNQTIFVRPPFYARFSINNTNKFIGTFFNHLDSPGYSSKTINENKANLDDYRIKGSQGAQEISEFLAIKETFDYFDKKYNDNLLIYGGDTNIKSVNYFLATKFVNDQTKIQSTLDINQDMSKKSEFGEQFITSLGKNKRKGNYSEQYDKMFFINNDKDIFVPKIINEESKDFKIDIYKAFQYYVKKEKLKQMNGWNVENNGKKDLEVVRNLISDHAPVFTDVKVNFDIKTVNVHGDVKTTDIKISKPENTIRIAHWNILNYGNNNSKAFALANIIYKSGFDIVGLTEVNYGSGEDVKLITDHLNSLANENGRFKFVYQPAKDSKIPKSLLDSKKFGEKQQEQVAVIYDSKNFKFKTSETFQKVIPYYY
ncbi:hypothetical protein LAD74_02120 [Mycoplasma sp. U97]|uniref:hypothetical protein n=1 Tax=Mycoplasma tauri TaxID=547987 RepID=UPI001CC13CCD|nr:hypothetical protein [Mycoplasma tauri]MBZ4212775.1 hypothetical protein [Mycoplasma tauri]